MYPDYQTIVNLKNPSLQLQQVDTEETFNDHFASFNVVAENSAIVGRVNVWIQPEMGLSGFVHFDEEGNILEWRTLPIRAVASAS